MADRAPGTTRPLPQRLGLVRSGLQHLLNGLEPEILGGDGGGELIEERIAALPDNVRLLVGCFHVSGEKPEIERDEFKSEDEWSRAYDEAVQWRDWQTCDILLGERDSASWWQPRQPASRFHVSWTVQDTDVAAIYEKSALFGPSPEDEGITFLEWLLRGLERDGFEILTIEPVKV